MIGFIKYTIFFSLNFLLLATPIKNKPLFEYAHDIAKPLIAPVYKEIGLVFTRGAKITKNLFRNASPDMPLKEYSDKVNSKLSAQYKGVNKSQRQIKKSSSYKEDFLDDIHDRDKKAIKGLFKE